MINNATCAEGNHMDPKVLKELQQLAITGRLYGRPSVVSITTLEHDKRKQAKLARALLAEGFIRLDKPDADDEKYVVTDQAYNLLTAKKPELSPRCFQRVDQYADNPSMRVTAHDIEKCQGVAWDRLTMEEQKWVVEHPAEYKVFSWNDSWALDAIEDYQIGIEDSFAGRQYAYNRVLYVGEHALDEERARRTYDNQFNYIRGRNLAWGLQKLGLLQDSPDNEKLITHSDGSDPFGRSSKSFGIDATKWPTDIQRVVKDLSDRIARDTAHLAGLVQLEQRISAAGGWDTFLERYDALIRDEMTKKENEKGDPR